MKGIVIWAHSKCRSTFDLFREIMRQSPVPVRLAFWQGALELRRAQGFSEDAFGEVPSVEVGDDWGVAEALLAETRGWVQVVCAYQVSRTFQRVMRVARERGDRVVVYSEAPCEMCVGVRAVLKRLYYRFVLPRRMRPVVACADLILSQSGTMGIDRLLRLGWRREQIVPFGYASARLEGSDEGRAGDDGARGELRVLHLGSEAAYRGVEVVERAVCGLRREGVGVRLEKSGGKMSEGELVRAIRRADVVVGCGLCEPWGMRINDAVQEGVPVVVSDGMGCAYLVEREGCGLVVPRGDVRALGRALRRCAEDREFLGRLRSGAVRAARMWAPPERARAFLEVVSSLEGSGAVGAAG